METHRIRASLSHPSNPPIELRHTGHQNYDPPPSNTTSDINHIPIEILQEVFSHLSLPTLLLQCRSVCHLWRQCIPGDSPALCVALFLPKPSHQSPITYPKTITPAYLRFDVELHGPFTVSESPQHATDYTVRLQVYQAVNSQNIPIALNPTLTVDLTRSKLEHYKQWWDSAVDAKPLWMNMLVCQPPMRTINMEFTFVGTDIHKHKYAVALRTRCMLMNSTGVTLGQSMRAIYKAMWWPEILLRCGHMAVTLAPSPSGELMGFDQEGTGFREGWVKLSRRSDASNPGAFGYSWERKDEKEAEPFSATIQAG
jgi:hypothetical protein